MAFKKSDILPNSKMLIYLFFFESRECGRIVLTWYERARSGEGQKTAAVLTRFHCRRHLSLVEAWWFGNTFCLKSFSEISWVGNKHKKWIRTLLIDLPCFKFFVRYAHKHYATHEQPISRLKLYYFMILICVSGNKYYTYFSFI